MKETKLLQAFNSLNNSELKALADWLQSPFFNKNANVLQLGLSLISTRRKRLFHADTKPDVLFRKAFPAKVYDERKMAYLMSDLLKQVEHFVTWQTIESKPSTIALYKIRACQQRDLKKSLHYHQSRLEQMLQGAERINGVDLQHRAMYYQDAETAFSKTGSRKANPYLQAAADSLDSYYWVTKLRLSIHMLFRHSALNEQYELRFIPSTLGEDLAKLPSEPLVQLYYQAYSLLLKDNAKALLQDFMQAIQHYLPLLAQEESTELFYYAINYCTRQIRRGHRTFTDELLQLYQDGLEYGVLLEEERISPWNYKNIVKLGLGLQQLDWAAEFVKTYSQRLPTNMQNDAYHFSMADISFHRKDYDGALAYLQRTEFSDVHYALGARVLQIRIYYETEAIEPLMSLLSSFHLYLLRNRLVGQGTKAAYLNFIRFTKKLVKARQIDAKVKLYEQIMNTPRLNARSWLLEHCTPPDSHRNR